MKCDSYNATVAGPINVDNYTLTLRRANEITPVQIECRITCHNVNPEYNSQLYLGIMYADRAQVKYLSIKKPHREPDVYKINSEITSSCGNGSNETNFISYIRIFPESPIILSTCSVHVTYDHDNISERCTSPGIAVIIYSAETTPIDVTEIEATTTLTESSDNTAERTKTDATTTSNEVTKMPITCTDVTSTPTFMNPDTSKLNSGPPPTVPPPTASTISGILSMLGTSTGVLIGIIAILLLIIGIMLVRRRVIPNDVVPQQAEHDQDVVSNTDAVDGNEE